MAVVFGPQEVTPGVVGTNLVDDKVRNHALFKKDEALPPGRGVRFYANVRCWRRLGSNSCEAQP